MSDPTAERDSLPRQSEAGSWASGGTPSAVQEPVADPARGDQPRRGALKRILESKAIRRLRFEDYRRRIRDHYDGPAGAFLATASLLSLHSPLGSRLLRRRRFDLRGAKRVLDVGSGAGQILRPLLKYADPDAQLVAVDLSPQMLRRSRQRMRSERPGWVAADLMHLPFPDAAFDCITCGWVLEHLPDPRPGLMELARVLEPGGRMLIFTTEDTLPGVLCSRTWNCRTYRRRELEAVCRDIGLPWRQQIWFTAMHRLLRLGGIAVEARKEQQLHHEPGHAPRPPTGIPRGA